MNLRGWMRKSPMPAIIRCHTANGPRDVVIDASDPRRWANAETSVLALFPAAVEALSADGKTLRAVNLEDTNVAPDEEEAKGTTAKESELVLIARLIKDAYNDGAANHAQAFEKSFAPMISMVDVMSQRLAGLEKALFRYASLNMQKSEEQPPEDAAMQTMLQAFMQGQAAKAAAAAKGAAKKVANGANGKTEA